MRSSSGRYYQGLDHVRALAAFLVFEWHYLHGPLSYSTVAPPPFSFIEEGNCGVALFMTLSGYLFAKLLDGKDVIYVSFLWNRFLRLAPLAVAILFYLAIRHHRGHMASYLLSTVEAFPLAEYKRLPHGMFSIAAEAQFYVVLPLLLMASKNNRATLLVVASASIVLRIGLYLYLHDIWDITYSTLIGRIDQFVFGIITFKYRETFQAKHILAITVFSAFAIYYWMYNVAGGLLGIPANSPFWIIQPTIDGACFGALIAYYDGSFSNFPRWFSIFAVIGECSYSIYLLHFFIAGNTSAYLADFLAMQNFYVSALTGVAVFFCFLPIAWLSFNFYEKQFLRLRIKYTRHQNIPVIA